MSITLKSWKILYDASITTDTSDISKYLDEVFTNLSGGANVPTIFNDGDGFNAGEFGQWFTTHYSASAGYFPRVVNSSYFRVQQFDDSATSTIPNSSKPKTIPTPFSYLLTERYRGTDFYDNDYFGIKTSIDSEIDAGLRNEGVTTQADINIIKIDLLKEHLQSKGYQTVLWDFFGQYRPTPPTNNRTVPELLKLYAKTLKDEGYNLKNLGASSNTPTAQSALEILQGSNAAAARATVQRSVNAVPPREYAEGDLQRFFQCALMSDLFIGPSGLPHDTPGSYAALKKSEKGYNKKIYPVGFEQNNGELNPGCFMNKLLYPDGTQEFFQNTEDLYPPDNNPGWYNGATNNKNHEIISKSIHFIEKIKVNGEFKLHEVQLNNIQNLGTGAQSKISAVNAANLPQLKSLLNQARAKPIAFANNLIQNTLASVDSSITNVSSLEQKLKALTFSANTGQTTEEIIFDGMTISFNGTNPSTARKDVKVDLKFTLTSLHALTSVVVGSRHDGTDLFLKDLVTVPDTHTSGNPVLKNDYSPDFNRIRIKAKARSNASNGKNHLPGSDLILDLAVIDHSLERGSENGTVTFSINYRGFFNSAMSMPFMDCLVDSVTTDKRIKRSNEFDDLARDFANQTVPTPNYPVVGAFAPENGQNSPPTEKDLRSFTKESRKLFENEKTAGATSDSFITRLVTKKKIREYTLHKPNMFTNFVNDGFFDYDLALNGQGFVTVSPLATTSSAKAKTVIADVKTNKQADEDKKETTSVTSGYFFYFGDLIDVVTDSIYDKNVPGQLKKEFKHLNLKFLISDIEIYDPVYKKRKVINICQMPIDVSYFAQWFNDVVVGKGLTFFPTSQMIISLAERMIGSLLYDICYGDTFANETPPRIRVGYFQDTRDSTSNDLKTALKDCENGTVFRKQFKSGDFNGAPIILRDADFVLSKTKQSTTYCIIYMQSPPFLLPLESGKVNSYRLKGITPQINYGKRFITYNYVSSVSFSKTDQPFLREARYFNNRALSMISNVYDLSFSFKEVGKKASTVLYPATTLEMFLRDWPDPTQWFPHYKDAIAGLLGFGGYFGISSVVYNLGVTDSQWSIDVKTKFLGTDSSAEVPQNNVAPKNVKIPASTTTPKLPGKPFIPASSTPAKGGGDQNTGDPAIDEDGDGSPAELLELANGTSADKAPKTLDPKALPAGHKLLIPGLVNYKGANYKLNAAETLYEKQ